EVAARHLPRAFDYVDALLRGFPYLSDQVFPVLIKVLDSPQAISALAAKLETNPPWRPSFLAALAAEAPESNLPRAVLAAIKSGPIPPTASEVKPYLDRLLKSELVNQAYADWRYFAGGDSDLKKENNYIYN